MAQHIERTGHLRQQSRIAVAVARDNLPDARAFRIARQRRQRGPALKSDLLRHLRDRVEMVVEPDRMIAQIVSVAGNLGHRFIRLDRISDPHQIQPPALGKNNPVFHGHS